MRYLLAIITVLSLGFVAPAFADTFCEMEGPHNCGEQIDDQLTAQTRKTINIINMTQDPHPFKTQNDEVLAAAAARSRLADNAPQQDQQKQERHWWN